MDLSLASLVTVATVAFLNGANDISRSIATLVGAGVRDYKKACKIGTIATVLGSALSFWLTTRMVETFTKSWTTQPIQASPALLLGLAITIAFWLTAMTLFGMPVSTTHSLVGSIIGVSLLEFGWNQILWGKVFAKIFLPLIFSPFAAILSSWLLYRALAYLDKVNPCLCVGEINAYLTPNFQGEVIAIVPARKFSFVVSSAQACRQFLRNRFGVTADHFHLLSATLIGFARALNDTPKIVAVGLLAHPSNHSPTFFALATLAMGVGSLLGGWRVTKTLAEKITPLDNRTGLSANLSTSFLVSVCAILGLPVSTTHVACGSIVGVGVVRGVKSVYWEMVANIAIAWFVTLPGCAILSATTLLTLLRL